jgi:hypothetical protein
MWLGPTKSQTHIKLSCDSLIPGNRQICIDQDIVASQQSWYCPNFQMTGHPVQTWQSKSAI